MAISLQNTYTSNFGDDWTQTFNIPSVVSSSGNVIVVAYSVRQSANQIAAAPTWNGETFTLFHTSSNESTTVSIYTLKCTTSATASILCSPTDWSHSAAVARVFSGTINLTDTFITAVTSFEDSTSTPWAAPTASISSTTGDIIVDFLHTANQDAAGYNLTGGTFTQDGGQSNYTIATNSANNYVGNVASSIEVAGSGTTSTSWTLSQQPRYVYVVMGIKGTSGTSIDDINTNEQVRVSSTGNTITTSGLGTLTTLTLGGKSATSISATGGDGTFSMPAFVDATTYSLLGTVTATAGDGTSTADLSVSLLPTTGWSYVTLSGTLNTTNTGVLYNFSPAASVGDQIVYETAKGTVDAQGNYEGDFDGTQTMWHIKASDGVTRSYDVITGVVGVTFNITGLSATMSGGTVTGTSGGVIKAITGLSMTASRGTISAVSGGIRYFITGLQSSTFLGSIVGSGGPVSSLSKDNLPKFLVKIASNLRKSFKKSFRKK